jgi:hypothetical protein
MLFILNANVGPENNLISMKRNLIKFDIIIDIRERKSSFFIIFHYDSIACQVITSINQWYLIETFSKTGGRKWSVKELYHENNLNDIDRICIAFQTVINVK